MKLDLSEIAANLGKRIKYEVDEEPIVDADSDLRARLTAFRAQGGAR